MTATAFISVILPVRNEEKFIRRCLDSIVKQTIPKDRFEVLVIDGNSTDKTAEIVQEYKKNNGFIKLLPNPDQNTIAGLNLGIKQSVGDIIVRVDGHAFLEEDYIEQCVKLLRETGADNVGGPMRTIGNSYFQNAVAYATSCVFGIGTGKFHYSEEEAYVDTVYLGAFRKSIFDEIGYFDPEMQFSEDNELNLRITKKGGKILLSPKIKSFYFPRESLSSLWKQYFSYGFYKNNVIRKHQLHVSLRHFVPMIFVLSIGLSFLLMPLSRWAAVSFFFITGIYCMASLYFSGNISIRKGLIFFPVLPVIFTTLHFSYGIGFLGGMIKFLVLQKSN